MCTISYDCLPVLVIVANFLDTQWIFHYMRSRIYLFHYGDVFSSTSVHRALCVCVSRWNVRGPTMGAAQLTKPEDEGIVYGGR